MRPVEPGGTLAVGSEVDESRIESLAERLREFERADFGEALSRAFAATANALAKSSQFFVEFGIGGHATLVMSSTLTCRLRRLVSRLASVQTASYRAGSRARIALSAPERSACIPSSPSAW